ncbi:ATP-binding protein [Tenacibaculum sp. HL-MS23]|uniref:sensor histidine kinase n=1 Tax=Tenacibaculum sp. HL-MS23 TaxID=3077734 RepID=UPI0028FC2605|nr:ATP-binding protein [Tenacibaculum sp. HL-MS23]WNW02519.1 ATP-binding protein [Tenacibaculum sp. HL-MS23]
MNSLLKRQIRKYLAEELLSDKKLETFLDAIDKSYKTSENQFAMLQRATAISSEELFDANQKLKEETNSQRKVIEKLKNVIDTLKFYDLEQDKPIENSDLLKLVDFIDNQTKEIIKINQQKDSLLKSLEQQNQELNDYTHMISHDLKTPIQNIEALSVWLKEDSGKVLDSEGKERIELIRENTQKIDTLVKAIHTYSTIDREKQKRSNLDLDKLLKTILKEFNLSENINVHIPEKLPNIKGDKNIMEQLFTNLIDNSIKFNGKENKKIEIGYSDEKIFWKFYVKDNGKGIDKKYFQKVFVAFSKLENDYKSAGIGLSIAKKIVDVYKGDIWIESELNEGSTFYFTLKK